MRRAFHSSPQDRPRASLAARVRSALVRVHRGDTKSAPPPPGSRAQARAHLRGSPDAGKWAPRRITTGTGWGSGPSEKAVARAQRRATQRGDHQ